MPIYHAIYNVVDGQDTIDASKWNAPHTIDPPLGTVDFNENDLENVGHIFPATGGEKDIGSGVLPFRYIVGRTVAGQAKMYIDGIELRGPVDTFSIYDAKHVKINEATPGNINETTYLWMYSSKASPATIWSMNLSLNEFGNLIFDVPRNLMIELPDVAGEFEVQVKDGLGATVYRVDSDGNIDFAGAIQRSIAEFQNQPVTSGQIVPADIWTQIATITLTLNYPKTLLCLGGTEFKVLDEVGLCFIRINVDGDAGYSGRSAGRFGKYDNPRGFLETHLVRSLSTGPHTIYLEFKGEIDTELYTGELSVILL